MRRSAVVLLSTTLTAGCASGGASEQDVRALDPSQGVELIVRNETSRVRRAFVQWEGGSRMELGVLPERASRMFVVPVRGQAMRVVFSRGRRQGGGFARVVRGDRLEWTLQAAGGVFFRRLGSP